MQRASYCAVCPWSPAGRRSIAEVEEDPACMLWTRPACGRTTYTPSGAVKEVILRVTERAQKEVIARVGLGFGRCCP